MGLDIRGYSNVKEIKNPRVDDTDELIQLYIGEFTYQAGDLVSSGYYEVEECGGAFSMGYGGYGFFREQIAELSDYKKMDVPLPEYGDDDYENKMYYHRHPHVAVIYMENKEFGDLPFIEMIAFSDCEGVICTEVCKKLYKDFVEFKDKAEVFFKEQSGLFDKYKDLMECFEVGSKDGFVIYQ